MRSSDGGKTWSKRVLSEGIHALQKGGATISPYGKIVQLADGTVLMAVYYEFFDDRGNQSFVFRSHDGGKTGASRSSLVSTRTRPESWFCRMVNCWLHFGRRKGRTSLLRRRRTRDDMEFARPDYAR